VLKEGLMAEPKIIRLQVRTETIRRKVPVYIHPTEPGRREVSMIIGPTKTT
jgi:hypothetical protein